MQELKKFFQIQLYTTKTIDTKENLYVCMSHNLHIFWLSVVYATENKQLLRTLSSMEDNNTEVDVLQTI